MGIGETNWWEMVNEDLNHFREERRAHRINLAAALLAFSSLLTSFFAFLKMNENLSADLNLIGEYLIGISLLHAAVWALAGIYWRETIGSGRKKALQKQQFDPEQAPYAILWSFSLIALVLFANSYVKDFTSGAPFSSSHCYICCPSHPYCVSTSWRIGQHPRLDRSG